MMPDVMAPRREPPPVKERPATASVESVESKEAESDDEQDGTRSVQDLIAAALKMFANTEPAIAPAPVEAPVIALSTVPNIEAAVQQVLDQITAKPDTTSEPSTTTDEPEAEAQAPDGMIVVEPELHTGAPVTSKGPVATTAVREPAPLPENENPSHVHLVLDDGPERVVVTVAVRGSEVNATIRGGDEQTAAAIARNAASLDHALRAAGLDLSSFTSERDLDHHTPREHEQREQHEDATFDKELLA